MTPATYETVAEYTADVVAARKAYAADQEVAEGFCETGDGRKGGGRRRCWMCRHGQGSA